LLTNPNNQIRFTESAVISFEGVQEVTETMQAAVQLDQSDLMKVLSVVEGEPLGLFTTAPNRPQLLVLDLKLEKKNVVGDHQVFSLFMKLLKREYK
jgi:hypothetical protein